MLHYHNKNKNYLFQQEIQFYQEYICQAFDLHDLKSGYKYIITCVLYKEICKTFFFILNICCFVFLHLELDLSIDTWYVHVWTRTFASVCTVMAFRILFIFSYVSPPSDDLGLGLHNNCLWSVHCCISN